MNKGILIAILLILLSSFAYGQNIAITDDNAYTAHSSAMLDVKSSTKGMLVPRMTSVQRDAIASPATGLLIFDTNENVFYYYTGTVWSNLSVGQLWTKNGNYVYLSNTDDNVGIGVTTPENKLLVKADASTGIDESIFAVLNNAGDTVFAVYQEGVRIWVNDAGGAKANGSRGGFAVGGFNPAKAGLTNEYLRVTPDSVRVYIDETYVGAKANGSRGGFAVGGFNPAKGTNTENYLIVSLDTTETIVPSEPRVLWYPTKEAFLTGRVIIESKDSIGVNSFASGFESKAIGNYSQALGYHSRAFGNNSTAIGNYANAEFDNSIAFGDSSQAKGVGAYAIGSVGRLPNGSSTGVPTQANGDYSFALGMGARADVLGAFAIGNNSWASGIFSMALGYESDAWGDYSLALGSDAHAGNYASALGYSTFASGNYSTAMGNECNATGSNSLACGFFNESQGDASMAFGSETWATGDASTTFGYHTFASGDYSLSGGCRSVATGYTSFAFGDETEANNFYSIAFGRDIKVNGMYSFGIALNNQAGAIVADNNTMAIMGGEVGIGTLSPDYMLDIAGRVNLIKGIPAGIALSVNGDEAIWYDGTCFSWGFGGTANYFADNVGIGVTNPLANLHIVGDPTMGSVIIAPSGGANNSSQLVLSEISGNEYNMSLVYDGADNYLKVFGYSDPTTYGPHLMIGRTEGEVFMPNVYADAIAVTYRDLYIRSDGQLGYIASSKRYKKNIKNMENIEWLYDLRPVNYIYKTDKLKTKEYGLIAEEVEKINSSFVSYNDENEVETVSYSKLVSPMLKALIEQNNINKSQENRISVLENQNQSLKAEIENIKTLLNQSVKK